MLTEKEKNENEYIEVEYREIHKDENGKEYYKDAVTNATPLKIIPIICAVVFIVLAVVATTISPILALGIMIVFLFIIKPLKEKVLIPRLLKTGKYYDNTKWDKN